MKFIVTIRNKDILNRELQMLLKKYTGSNLIGSTYCINPREICYEFKNWLEVSLDSSFSIIRNAIGDCKMCYEQAGIVSTEAWNRINVFFFQLQKLLPYARKDNEWPSCKELLNHSEKDIVKKFQELIKDEIIKQNIRTVLKITTMKEAITVGHLAMYYIESLISIENELWASPDDPHGNKHRLLLKFSEELDYCMQVVSKINVEIAQDKMMAAQEAQRRCEEMKSNYPAIGEACQ
ncbi:MAG: hypothetical protein IJ761_01135 [Bacteroidales bacterium]|nr:hypothetical protein [Bacteroidales bacterium]